MQFSVLTLAGFPSQNRRSGSREKILEKEHPVAIGWLVIFSSSPKPRGMLTGMKVRDVLKLLKADGWYKVPAKGGHRQFKHPTKPGRATSPGR
jgi:predicted RNA binding protein YcfA (HicA-like mRNA interferase family)